MSMIHAMSVKKANKGKKEKEESCTDQVNKKRQIKKHRSGQYKKGK